MRVRLFGSGCLNLESSHVITMVWLRSPVGREFDLRMAIGVGWMDDDMGECG